MTLTQKELENRMFHYTTKRLKKLARSSGRRAKTAKYLLRMQKKGAKI